jgi:hypothetical protein
MGSEVVLLMHPAAGVLGVIAAVWVFVETLNARGSSSSRVVIASVAAAVMIWLSYLVGGYWYVTEYGADKALIKAGPWPFAHSFVTETKEHIFFTLLLLATYLPIAVLASRKAASRGTSVLILWTSGLVALLGLSMEGMGAVMNLGVKVALLAKQAVGG